MLFLGLIGGGHDDVHICDASLRDEDFRSRKTQASPSKMALVCVPLASLPAFGSVSPQAPVCPRARA